MKPIVGIGIIVKKENLILLGKRKNPDGSTCWSLPGGKIELYEDFRQCTIRELKEETNLCAEDEIKIFSLSNVIEQKTKMHSITIGALVTNFTGDLQNTEPKNFEEWKWFKVDDFPNDLFLPTRFVYKAFLSDLNASLGTGKSKIDSRKLIVLQD